MTREKRIKIMFCLALLRNMILLIDCKGKASRHTLIKLENESQKLVLIENFRKLGKQLSRHTSHAFMYYIALLTLTWLWCRSVSLIPDTDAYQITCEMNISIFLASYCTVLEPFHKTWSCMHCVMSKGHMLHLTTS